ncbi:MAG TPA: tetratricopeptide repeat protein [Vicinamibacteria bacterium]|nr:tetratricopeptide repeat protein [Vicinamibacteria bacterium]
MTSVLLFALALTAQDPAAPAPPEAPAAALLAEARRLLDDGQPALAIATLGAAAGGGDARVAQLLGVAYYHANDHPNAIEHLTAALPRLREGSLERREAVQVLGLSSYLAGRVAESVPYLEETRALAPNNAELAYVLGMAYIQTRQADKARETWARSFKVPADSAAAHLLTARMMVRAEFDDAAEEELKKALARDPRLPHAHFLLGQTALFRGRLEEAVALLRKELELNPGDAMAFYRLGDAYSRQLEWDEAIAALQRSAWLNPYYSGPYLLLGRAYVKKGQPAAAEGMLRRAIQYDPNNKAAHYLLGQLLQQAGRVEEARRELEIAERLQGAAER